MGERRRGWSWRAAVILVVEVEMLPPERMGNGINKSGCGCILNGGIRAIDGERVVRHDRPLGQTQVEPRLKEA